MTAEQAHYIPNEAQESEMRADPWGTITVGREEFRVKKDRVFPMIYKDEDVIFKVNEYHHPETGTQITVFSLGMDRPTNDPAIVRADYGCPCMSFGPSFKIPGHDCGPQRNMMLETIAELGIGAMAVVSEQTAAGNGHGAHVVFDQSTRQYEARQQGETVPSMQDFYSENGHFPFDKRRHDLVGKVLADTVGQDRLVIPAMSSQRKVQELADAGLKISEDLRVDLVTDTSGIHDHILRRDNYAHRETVRKPGAYLVYPQGDGNLGRMRLIKDTYDIALRPQSLVRQIPVVTRRLPN